MDKSNCTVVRLLDDRELDVWLEKVLSDGESKDKENARDIIRRYESMIVSSVYRMPPR
jgi:hypothetical protein